MLAIPGESGLTYLRTDRIDGFKINYDTLEVTICLNGQTIMTLLGSKDEADKITKIITEKMLTDEEKK